MKVYEIFYRWHGATQVCLYAGETGTEEEAKEFLKMGFASYYEEFGLMGVYPLTSVYDKEGNRTPIKVEVTKA